MSWNEFGRDKLHAQIFQNCGTPSWKNYYVFCTFHIVSHQCACTKAMTALIYSTISNADGEAIMMVIFRHVLAT
jgi:hypothetical protein